LFVKAFEGTEGRLFKNMCFFEKNRGVLTKNEIIEEKSFKRSTK